MIAVVGDNKIETNVGAESKTQFCSGCFLSLHRYAAYGIADSARPRYQEIDGRQGEKTVGREKEGE